jgi:hypothetical protein
MIKREMGGVDDGDKLVDLDVPDFLGDLAFWRLSDTTSIHRADAD